MELKMKGLILEVYRSKGMDCTNGGVSATADELLLVGPGVPEIFEPNGRPVVRLKMSNGGAGYCHLVPDLCAGKWTQFGGNFAYTSDSRFSEIVEKFVGHEHGGPIKIHDRVE
jgi:hypothetical protein